MSDEPSAEMGLVCPYCEKSVCEPGDDICDMLRAHAEAAVAAEQREHKITHAVMDRYVAEMATVREHVAELREQLDNERHARKLYQDEHTRLVDERDAALAQLAYIGGALGLADGPDTDEEFAVAFAAAKDRARAEAEAEVARLTQALSTIRTLGGHSHAHPAVAALVDAALAPEPDDERSVQLPPARVLGASRIPRPRAPEPAKEPEQ